MKKLNSKCSFLWEIGVVFFCFEKTKAVFRFKMSEKRLFTEGVFKKFKTQYFDKYLSIATYNQRIVI